MKYNTKTRQIIIDFFKNNPDKSFNNQEIWKLLKDNNQEIGLTSIYRMTRSLTDEFVLTESIIDKVAYYRVHNHEHSPHLHAECQNCHETIHLDEEISHDISDILKKEYKFNIKVEQTNLKGICKKCQEKK